MRSPYVPIPDHASSAPEWAQVGLLVHATLERIGRKQLGLPRAHRKLVTLDELAMTCGAVASTRRGATKRRVDEAIEILCAASPSSVHLDWRDCVEVEHSREITLPDGTSRVIRFDRLDVTMPASGPPVVHVIDWKTAEPHVEGPELHEDPQAARYLLGARSLYPFAHEWWVSFVWLGMSDRKPSATRWTPGKDERIRFAAAQ